MTEPELDHDSDSDSGFGDTPWPGTRAGVPAGPLGNVLEALSQQRRNQRSGKVKSVERAASCRPLRTDHGPLPLCRDVERWPDGVPRRCTPAASCRLMTQAGVLTPRSEPDEPRHPRVSPIQFHANGQVARVALNEPADVPTPLGSLPAELVLFHDDGSIKRVFPANGKLSQFWSMEDEEAFVPRLRLPTPLGALEARCISVAFHPTGALRSITLWPTERVAVQTSLGSVSVRHGLSFRPDGTLESLEPARPWLVETPIGRLEAFDPQPIGLNADASSLVFGSDGSILGLTTVRDVLVVRDPEGSLRRFETTVETNDCADGCATGGVLRLRFEDDSVVVRHGATDERIPLAAVTLEREDDGRRHLPCLG